MDARAVAAPRWVSVHSPSECDQVVHFAARVDSSVVDRSDNRVRQELNHSAIINLTLVQSPVALPGHVELEGNRAKQSRTESWRPREGKIQRSRR